MIGEGIENVLGQSHRRRGDAHATALDFCLGADLLRGLEGSLERPVEPPAGVTVFQSELVGLLQLPEDFRLTHHHRVEPRRHAEKVSKAVWLGERVEFRAEWTFVFMELGEKFPHRRESPCRIAICGDRVDFHPVAGREDHGLLDVSASPENLKRLGNPRFSKGETLAQLDWRGMVAQSQRDDHGLCKVESRFVPQKVSRRKAKTPATAYAKWRPARSNRQRQRITAK